MTDLRGPRFREIPGFRAALLLLASLLWACPPQTCPELGQDGTVIFDVCLGQGSAVQSGSSASVGIHHDDSSPDDRITAVSADDPALGRVDYDAEEDEFTLGFLAPGTVTFTLETAEGRTDRLTWDVTRALNATVLDPYSTFAEILLRDSPEQVFGEVPRSHPGAHAMLREGHSIAFELELLDGQDEVVQWTPGSLRFEGAVDSESGRTLDLRGSGEARVLDDTGTVIRTLTVEEYRTIPSGTLALGVYVVDRQDVVEGASGDPEDERDLAYLRAVVTDADERVLFQPPVEWRSRGPGEVVSFVDPDNPLASGNRTDIAVYRIDGLDAERADTLRVCVGVRVETEEGPLTRSLLLLPGAVEQFADDHCGASCACDAGGAGSPAAAALLVLSVAAAGRRRVRDSIDPDGAPRDRLSAATSAPPSGIS